MLGVLGQSPRALGMRVIAPRLLALCAVDGSHVAETCHSRSVGSVAGFIGAITACCWCAMGRISFQPPSPCLALGTLIGAAQGYWVAYFKIPSFIVTPAGIQGAGARRAARPVGQSDLADFSEALLRLHSETVLRRRQARARRSSKSLSISSCEGSFFPQERV